jgi:hypothetical protein
MPGLDQTGPLGRGRKSGRGLGRCIASPLTEIPTDMMDSVKSDGVVYGVGRGGIPCGRGRRFWNK